LGRIDLDRLPEEFADAGSDAIWWGELAAQAKRRAGELKVRLDILKAQLGSTARAQAIARAERPTDRAVEEVAIQQPEYWQAQTAWLEAQEHAEILESAKYALVRKQSALESLGNLVVQELQATRPAVFVPRRTPV
jgi:hypothetical protein